MSFLMYSRPLPKEDPPEPDAYLAIKHPIAKMLWESDGSVPNSEVVDNKFIPVLTGMKAMAVQKDTIGEIDSLIKIIKDNPQGVRIWIGDPDDFFAT